MAPVDFESQVLERSRGLPVVVDFWAPWCAPCRALGPAIEELAEADADRWTLVKLNTDEQPEIARRYGIQGIPAVKLFIYGEVRAEFVGALSKGEIRSWLDENLPDGKTDGLGALTSRWIAEGAGLVDELERFVAENPDHAEARLRLAQAVLAVDPERTRKLADAETQDVTLAELVEHLDTQFGEQLARRAAVALFYLLGQDHESTREHRRRLAAALHS